MKNGAAKHGGVVMSKRIKRLRFQYKEGHTWWTYPYNINAGVTKRKNWCKTCAQYSY